MQEGTIHQEAGAGSTSAIELRLAAERACSAAPREGSRNSNSTGASSSAGRAAKTIAVRHPQACAAGPLKKKLSAPPIGTPNMNNARALARRSGGNRSPIQLVAAGANVASPTATPSREASSRG